jgi:hypothetical protein
VESFLLVSGEANVDVLAAAGLLAIILPAAETGRIATW